MMISETGLESWSKVLVIDTEGTLRFVAELKLIKMKFAFFLFMLSLSVFLLRNQFRNTGNE